MAEERVQGCRQGHPEGGRAVKLGSPSTQTSPTPCLGSAGTSSGMRAQGMLEKSPSSEDEGDGCVLLQRCQLHTSAKPLAPCTRAGGCIEKDARQKQPQFPPPPHPQLSPQPSEHPAASCSAQGTQLDPTHRSLRLAWGGIPAPATPEALVVGTAGVFAETSRSSLLG